MSTLNEIADAVVDLLNDSQGEYGPLLDSFTAERVYVPIFDRVATNELNVVVVGMSETISIEGGSRGATDQRYVVKVVILKKVMDGDNGELDSLSDFRQEVRDLLLANKRLPLYQDAALVGVNVIAPYDQSLIERGTFATAIEVTYAQLA